MKSRRKIGNMRGSGVRLVGLPLIIMDYWPDMEGFGYQNLEQLDRLC